MIHCRGYRFVEQKSSNAGHSPETNPHRDSGPLYSALTTGRASVSRKTEWTAQEDQRALQAEIRQQLDTSHRRAKEIILRGGVAIDGNVVTDPGFRLRSGQQLRMDPDPPRLRTAHRKMVTEGLEILHQDRQVLVVQKPAGLLTVATEEGENEITLQTEVYRRLRHEGEKRPILFIVQRLDKDTSGVIVLARTPEARDAIKHQLLNTKFKRRYLALCKGTPRQEEGICDFPLHTDARNKRVRVARPHDPCKSAITHWKLQKKMGDHSLLEVHLETGRRNQIRVHLGHIQLPIMGDEKYGVTSPWIRRAALHAESLTFVHPKTLKEMTFQVDPPADFTECLSALEKTAPKS